MQEKNKLVALCTSRVYEPQIHGFIVKLNELLRKKGYSLLIFAINSDIYWEEDRQATEKYVFDLIPYEEIDSVIIMDEKIKSHKIANKIIDRAQSFNLPVIVADGYYENVSTINFDYEKGFELVVRHIIEKHNVTKLHMIAGQPDNDFSNARIEIFKKVLADENIPFDDSMISYGYFWSDPCRVAVQELMDRDELPEAIVCANDIMAITTSEMLSDAGYHIPEDVIITGFDGYDEIYFTSPKITSVSCDIIHLAEATAQEFFDQIERKGFYNRKIVPVLLPNESCGCKEYNTNPQLLRDWFNESFSRHNDDNRVLQQVTSSMQISQTPGELVSYLDCYKTDDLLCVIDRECFDSENNYFTIPEIDKASKQFIIIYDSDNKDNYKPDTFVMPDVPANHNETIMSEPFRDRILELTKSGFPLIINALDYMNRPFGFVCYYFRNYFISNYTNSMNATNAISVGIGGYINMQYQRTLADKMDEMYRHDSLTGLFNRIGFQNAFKRKCKKPGIRNSKVTVIMSDLDGLKYINDHYGHAEGDNAISVVASALFSATPEDGLSARFGGDELFSVVFGECNPSLIIQKIDSLLKQYNEYSGKPYDVSTSSGYVTLTLDDEFNITQAVKDADENMYRIKKNKYENGGYPFMR